MPQKCLFASAAMLCLTRLQWTFAHTKVSLRKRRVENLWIIRSYLLGPLFSLVRPPSIVAMAAKLYYGKKTNFVGKTLFEILANLRDFGVNRMLIKNEELLRNPGQKCYYVVKKVEPIMDEKLEQGAIYAERIFRGAKVPGLVFVDDETWHPDWQLVPKDEEHLHKVQDEKLVEHGHPDTVEVLPRWMEAPPLMDIFLRRHYKARKGVTVAPVKLETKPMHIRMHYNFELINKSHKLHRIAEEGESPQMHVYKPPSLFWSAEWAEKQKTRIKPAPEGGETSS